MEIRHPVRLAGLIIFILWSMGKVPYGVWCWIIPLMLDYLALVIRNVLNKKET